MSPAGKGKANPFFGKKHTEEARRKMSEAATGRVLSEEHKRKIGEASKRRAMTEASRRRLAEYNRTKVVSTETRQKISLAVKRQWESPEGRQKFLDSRKKAIPESIGDSPEFLRNGRRYLNRRNDMYKSIYQHMLIYKRAGGSRNLP